MCINEHPSTNAHCDKTMSLSTIKIYSGHVVVPGVLGTNNCFCSAVALGLTYYILNGNKDIYWYLMKRLKNYLISKGAKENEQAELDCYDMEELYNEINKLSGMVYPYISIRISNKQKQESDTCDDHIKILGGDESSMYRILLYINASHFWVGVFDGDMDVYDMSMRSKYIKTKKLHTDVVKNDKFKKQINELTKKYEELSMSEIMFLNDSDLLKLKSWFQKNEKQFDHHKSELRETEELCERFLIIDEQENSFLKIRKQVNDSLEKIKIQKLETMKRTDLLIIEYQNFETMLFEYETKMSDLILLNDFKMANEMHNDINGDILFSMNDRMIAELLQNDANFC